MSTDPFTPQGPLPPELFQRYLRGELDAADRHRVERHLEHDPLLREAAEGLSMPGALEAFRNLQRPGWNAGTPVQWGAWGLAVLVTAGMGTWLWLRSMDRPGPEPWDTGHSAGTAPLQAPGMDSMLKVVHAEIDRAGTPDTLVMSPEVESFVREEVPVPPVVRDTLPVLVSLPPALPVRTMPLDTGVDAPEPARLRPSRRLVFLHDLKLVHPEELYPANDPRRFTQGHPANASGDPSGIAEDALFAKGVPTDMAYLNYMDEALGALAQGRTGVALDDLLFLLNQYPDDVNAQFYAGLCCFRAGLYGRARVFFARAERNAVDSFQEEAVWYSAKTTHELEGLKAARPAYERIASAKGFYAAQAAERLR